MTFLGTGAAGGVPLYGCTCVACTRAAQHRQHERLPCSALIELGSTRVLLDAGLTDLHQRFAPGSLSAIVLTHFHPDHVQGLLHLRWGRGARIPVYAPPDAEGCADLYKHPGLLDFRRLAKFEVQDIGGLRFTPLPLVHSKPTFGYAVQSQDGVRLAYLTDTLGLPQPTQAFLNAWPADGLALDCSYPPRELPARGHNDLPLALATIASLRPRRAWLTHIGHELDAWLMNAAEGLPANVRVARDGESCVLAPQPARDPL